MLLIAARSRVAALCAVLEKTEGAPVRLIETHISWVLIARALASKIRKPVHLPSSTSGSSQADATFVTRSFASTFALRPTSTSMSSTCAMVRPDRASEGRGRCSTSPCGCTAFRTVHSGASGWPRERSRRRRSMLLHAASPTIIAMPLSRHREAPSGRRPSTTVSFAGLPSLSTLG